MFHHCGVSLSRLQKAVFTRGYDSWTKTRIFVVYKHIAWLNCLRIVHTSGRLEIVNWLVLYMRKLAYLPCLGEYSHGLHVLLWLFMVVWISNNWFLKQKKILDVGMELITECTKLNHTSAVIVLTIPSQNICSHELYIESMHDREVNPVMMLRRNNLVEKCMTSWATTWMSSLSARKLNIRPLEWVRGCWLMTSGTSAIV